MLFGRGDIIRFTYPSKSDKFKQGFVLNEHWNGKVHALDMKRMTVAEWATLRLVMDPKSRGKKHRIPLVNDILNRMDPPELLDHPISFYNQFVKPFIRNKDLYRTYYPAKMTAIQIVDVNEASRRVSTTRSGGVFGKPLFGS